MFVVANQALTLGMIIGLELQQTFSKAAPHS